MYMKKMMKRKWPIRIAAVLLSCVAAGSLLWKPPVAADSAKTVVADNRTLNTWDTVNFAQDTKNTGRIWTDKSVSADAIELRYGNVAGERITKTEGSDFIVSLSAISSSSSLTTSVSKPLDIVLVLDVSGSMDQVLSYSYSPTYNPSTSSNGSTSYYILLESGEYQQVSYSRNSRNWGYGSGNRRVVVTPMTSANDTNADHVQFYAQVSYSKLEGLKKAAVDFVNATAELNGQITDETMQHRIALVKFAGNVSSTVGNTRYNGGGSVLYNHTQIISHLADFNAATMVNTINNINAGGATRAASGIAHANTVLARSREDAQKVMVFFTDGEPNQGNDFWPSEAAQTVTGAKTLKDADTIVYTVGVWSNADPSLPTDTDSVITSQDFNAYLHSVSSNFPDATATYSGGDDSDSTWRLTMGQRAPDSDYYKVAADAVSLENIFHQIFEEITTLPAAPTTTDPAHPQSSGYITFTDKLGAFMEVKGANAIVYDDKVYTVHDVRPGEDGTTIYEFTQNVTDVNQVYPGSYSLKNLLIRVTPGKTPEDGDSVAVMIPAALLPLRHYDIDEDGVLTITEAYPVRVLYSVGMKEGVDAAVSSGRTDAIRGLTAYMKANSDENGRISFYSNAWSDPEKGGTIVTFSPASTNNFYYFIEDTPLYTDEGCTQPLTAAPVEGRTYYYKYVHYSNELQDGHSTLTYSPVAAHHSANSTQYLGKNDDGYYVLAGTPRYSFSNAEGQRMPKPAAGGDHVGGTEAANATNTASYVLYPTWINGIVRNYLGNNGRISYVSTGSVAISKTVTADEGLTAPAAAEFTFQVSFDKAGTNLEGTYATELRSVGSADASVGSIMISADGTGTVTMKAGQTLTIYGLPGGTSYTVKETQLPGGFTQTSATGATGTVTVGDVQTAAFTNNYAVTPVASNVHYPVTKAVVDENGNVMDWTGKDWSFNFVLSGITSSAPMPTNQTITITKADQELCFGFENVEFTKPGVYSYTITEVKPTTSENRLAGISYSSAAYRLEMTVTDNGDGTLSIDDRLLWITRDDNAYLGEDTVVTKAAFTNTYHLDSLSAGPVAHKKYVDLSGGRALQAGEFSFSINPVGDNAEEAPTFSPNVVTNDADGLVRFGSTVFTQEHVGKMFTYELREIIPENKLSGMTYADEVYRIEITVFAKAVDNQDDTVAITAAHYQKDGDGWKRISAVDASGNPIVGFMPFTNTYDPDDASLALKVQKTLEGRSWTADDSFSFTLTAIDGAPMPGSNAAVVTDATAGGVFGNIVFDQVGTYRYQITENVPAQTKGITYDAHTTLVTVTVTDNGGALTATAVYDNTTAAADLDKAVTDAAAFTNTYQAAEVVMTPSTILVSKTLQGREWKTTDEFTFSIWPDGMIPAPSFQEQTIDWAGRNETLAFDQEKLTYTEAGVYTYFITESAGTIPGITYDRTIYRVQVTVADDGVGNLKVTDVTYATSTIPENMVMYVANMRALTYTDTALTAANFTNIYAPREVTLTGSTALGGEKVLVGRDSLDDESFDFLLTRTDNQAGVSVNGNLAMISGLPAGVSRRFVFGDVTFTKAGTYTFSIREDIPQQKAEHMTYDGHVCDVTVVVTDNLNGRLVAEVTYSDGAQASFTNIYYNENEAKSVSDSTNSIDGQLVSAGQELTYIIDWINTALDDSGKPAAGTVTIVDTIPAGTSYVAGSAGEGVYADGKITWTISALAAQRGAVGFKVKVDDDLTDGAEITNRASVNGVQTNAVTNYVPGKAISKPATEIQVGDVLTYTITYFNTNETAATVRISDVLQSSLDFVRADNGGSYNADSRTVTWIIEDAAPGKGSVTVQVKVNETALSADIVNQASVEVGHTATTNIIQEEKPGTGELTISKTVTGSGAPNALFQFEIQLEGLTGTYNYTVSNGATGHLTSGDIIYLQNGESTTVTGLPLGTRYTVTEVEIPAGFAPDETVKTGTVAANSSVRFTNTFTPAVLNGAEALKVGKSIVGEDGITAENWPDDWRFKFRISSARSDLSVPLPAATDVVVSKDAPTGYFGNIVFTAPGVYNYVITEVHPTDGRHVGIDYSHAAYLVTVTVTAGDGKLEASSTMVQYNDQFGEELSEKPVVEVAQFNNRYYLEEALWGPGAQKHVDNRSGANHPLQGGEFHFTATPVGANADEAPRFTQDAFNDPAGDVAFGTVAFTIDHVGKTYIYQIQETTGAIQGWTYTKQSYYAHVTVSKEHAEGQDAVVLSVKYTTDLQGENIVTDDQGNPVNELPFTNIYAPDSAKAQINVQKMLTRQWLAEESFRFQLTSISGAPMPAGSVDGIKTVDVDSQAVTGFGEISYDKVGIYYYEVQEIVPQEPTPGLIYDTHICYVQVTVVDNGGVLDASVEYNTRRITAQNDDDVAQFTNIYDNGVVVLTEEALWVTKYLAGRSWLSTDSFTFTIQGIDNAPMPANTSITLNSQNREGSFGTIQYTDAGTYTYQVTETAGTIPSITYDGSVYTVTVTVTDDLLGNLTVQSVDYKQDEELADLLLFTNTYKATNENATIYVSKLLNGFDGTCNEAFAFQLTGIGGAPMPASDIIRLTAGSTGHFEAISYSQAGTYEYQVRELIPDAKTEHMVYDGHTAKITVQVRDNPQTGKLVATVSYDNGGQAAQFTNVYYDPGDAKSVARGQMTVDGQPVSAGDVLTYSIKWANTSGGVGTVTVVDQVPAGTTVITGSANIRPTEWAPESGTLTWVLSNQPIGATGTITFQVKVRDDLAAGATLVNTAQVNNMSTNSVTNHVPGKSVDSKVAELGMVKTYTISYQNPGKQATKVIITDTLDENLTFVEAGNGGSYDAASRTVTWVIDSVAAGEGGSVTFQARLNGKALLDNTPNSATVQVGDHKATTNIVTVPKIETKNLTVSKTVELTANQGTVIDENMQFRFKVELWDAAKQTLTGSYSYTVDGEAAGSVQSGDTITLRHGQKAVIASLPEGTTYTVTEIDIPAGYTPKQPAISGALVSRQSVEFVNTYTVQGVTQAVLKARKELNGPDGTTLAANQFSFSVYTTADCSGTPVAAGKNDADGNVTFSEQTFTAAGRYVYYIRENQDPAAVHITYDTRIIRATVSIVDNGDGTLKLGGVSYRTLNGESISGTPKFVNEYKDDYTVGSFDVEAYKILTGRDLAADEFVFGLYDAQNNLIATGTNQAAADGEKSGVQFGMVNYALMTLQPEVPENYPITVQTENAPETLVRISDTALVLTQEELALVESGVLPELKIMVIGTELSDSDRALLAAAAPDAVLVQGVSLSGTKSVDGTDAEAQLQDAMKLTLAVEAAENRSYALVRIENGQVTVLEDLDGRGNGTLTVNNGGFGAYAIVYTETAPVEEAPAEETVSALTESKFRRTREVKVASEIIIPDGWTGECTFTIREMNTPALAGVTYSDAVYQVKITIYKDGNNLVASKPAYFRLSADGSTTAISADQVVFENRYKAAPTGEVSVLASKVLTNRDLTAGEFTFEAYQGDKLVTTATNDAQGNINLILPSFDAAGEYVYTIREKTGSDSTVIYSNEEYQITVTVTDNTLLGQLEAEVTYPETGVKFVNRYKKPVDVYLQALKELTGDRTLRDQEFTFHVTLDGKTVATAKNDAGGSITFQPITFSKEGTYTLEISEEIGSEIGVTYDTNTYAVKVTVAPGEDGALVATLENAQGITFRNTYTNPTPAQVDLEATKTLSGRKLVDGEFTFQVLMNGEILATATNTADGKIVFGSLRFNEAGTYVLNVQEVLGEAERVTYDTTIHTVVVEVTLQQDNTLLAQLQLPETGLTFRNTYTPPAGTPDTGDVSNALWIALVCLFSGAGAAALLLSRKRKAKA